MGQSESQDNKRESLDTQTLGGNLALIVKNNFTLPVHYKVKSPPMYRGPYGEIREAYHTLLKKKFLIKILFVTEFEERELREIKTEYQLMQDLKHPNIIAVHEFFQTPNFIYIVMEHFKGRDLFSKVKNEGGLKDEVVAFKVLMQITQTLRFLHSKNVIYRNLKLENLLFNGRQVAFYDFAAAKRIEPNAKLKDVVGSLHYLSPEMIKGKYDIRTDIWSFGLVMYTLLYGRKPFVGEDEAEIMNKILGAEPDYKSAPPISAEAIDLLRLLLTKDPEQRPTWAQIEEHEFFKRNIKREVVGLKLMFEKVKSNLLTFRSDNRFQLGLYMLYVNNCASNIDGSNYVKEIFNAIDKSATLKITQKDFRRFCESYGIVVSEQEVNQIFGNLDTNNSGRIDYSEFLAGCCDRKLLLTEKNMENYFNGLCEKERKTLTVNNLKKIFVASKVEDIQTFFDEFGASQTEGMKPELFVKVMQRMI